VAAKAILKGRPRFCSREVDIFRGFIGWNICSGAGLFLQRGAKVAVAPVLKRNWIEGWIMLSWVVTFLIVALIAGILGFGGVAGVSIEIAKAIFFIAVVLFLISAVVGLARGRTRV
jgi:uncharacterized membrane protein YtjA (UPF0391 family)